MIIKVYDERHNKIFQGPLVDFLKDNDQLDYEQILIDLASPQGVSLVGGGASPMFAILKGE